MALIPCTGREIWCAYTEDIAEVVCANIDAVMSVVLYTLGIEYM